MKRVLKINEKFCRVRGNSKLSQLCSMTNIPMCHSLVSQLKIVNLIQLKILFLFKKKKIIKITCLIQLKIHQNKNNLLHSNKISVSIEIKYFRLPSSKYKDNKRWQTLWKLAILNILNWKLSKIMTTLRVRNQIWKSSNSLPRWEFQIRFASRSWKSSSEKWLWNKIWKCEPNKTSLEKSWISVE